MKQTMLTQSYLEHLVMLLAGPIAHTSIQHMDFIEIFNISLDLSTVYCPRFSWCLASFVSSCYFIALFWNTITFICSFCFIFNVIAYQESKAMSRRCQSFIYLVSNCKVCHA